MEDFRQMNPVFLRSDETAVVIDDSIPLIMLFVEERMHDDWNYHDEINMHKYARNDKMI